MLKKQGIGTTVIYQGINHKTTFGLLLPGPGESGDFRNDQRPIHGTVAKSFEVHLEWGDFGQCGNQARPDGEKLRKNISNRKSAGSFSHRWNAFLQGNRLNEMVCRRIRVAFRSR